MIDEAIHLPHYGAEPIARPEFQPMRMKDTYACACGFSWDQLVKREMDGLVEQDGITNGDSRERNGNGEQQRSKAREG